MNWQTVLIHAGNFLLLPLFMGIFMGILSHAFYFKQTSRLTLMIASFTGSLAGLVAGWIITGEDGHTLNYFLLLLFSSLFILLTAKTPTKQRAKAKKR